jgi:hypothetical protein
MFHPAGIDRYQTPPRPTANGAVGGGPLTMTAIRPRNGFGSNLEHDAERWIPVFSQPTKANRVRAEITPNQRNEREIAGELVTD